MCFISCCHLFERSRNESLDKHGGIVNAGAESTPGAAARLGTLSDAALGCLALRPPRRRPPAAVWREEYQTVELSQGRSGRKYRLAAKHCQVLFF